MIDWLTLRLSTEYTSEAVQDAMRQLNGRIQKISSDGVIEWTSPAFENLRSDSHQITVRVGSELELLGSPARVTHENNVFGSDDIRFCADAMIRFASVFLNVALPRDVQAWKVTRIDITQNYDLSGPTNVENLLEVLSKTQGGHFRVSTQGRTVYWNQRSTFKSGKAYHKGPHLALQVKKQQAEATKEQIEYSQRLIRLELKLGRHYLSKNVAHWWSLTKERLIRIHNDYFQNLIGGSSIMNDEDVLPRIKSICATESLANKVYGTWLMIGSVGLSASRKYISRATWYRHQKILKDAGLKLADFEAGKVVPFRMKTIELETAVEEWPSNLRLI